MRTALSLLILISFSYIGYAQCDRTLAFTNLFGNDIIAPVTTGGSLFWDGRDQSLGRYYDEGQPATLLNEGLWLGGRSPDGTLRVAASLYGISVNSDDYYPGPLPSNGNFPQYDCSGWNRIFSVRRFEVEQHLADFADNGVVDAPLPVILEWPAKGNPHFEEHTGLSLPNDELGLAPYRDVNQNGIYDPLMGDYPALKGIEALPVQLVWNIFNDLNGPHEETNALPLGVEVQRTVWAFGCADNPLLNQSVFVRYNIINRSAAPIEDMRMGLFTDFDIGCHLDDYMGSAPELNAFFGYNAAPVDQQICNAGVTAFQGSPPINAAILLDKSFSSIQYVTSFDHSMSSVTYPTDSLEIFNLANGLFSDGTPLTEGGSGYESGGPPTSFAFPGHPADPDSWALPNTAVEPGDFRPVGGIEIGMLLPGESFEATTARVYTATTGLSFSEGFDQMFEDLAHLQTLYDQQFEAACATPAPCATDCVWPGDMNNDGIANHEDLINMGLNLGQTGPARTLPPAWGPQSSGAWAAPGQQFADADGNGSITPEDILITLLHYGNTRQDYAPVHTYPEGPELQAANVIGGVFGTFFPSESYFGRIQLDAPPKLKGLAFELEYDPRYLELTLSGDADPITDTRISIAQHASNAPVLQYADFQLGDENSWINGDLIFKAFNLHTYDSYTEPLPSDTTYLRFRNVLAVKPDGAVLDLGGMDAMVLFDGLPIVSTREDTMPELSVYPNPSNGQLHVRAPGQEWESIRLISPTGQVLLQQQGYFSETQDLDLSGFPAGLYWLQVESQGQWANRKVILTP